jgi:hypothetical protein
MRAPLQMWILFDGDPIEVLAFFTLEEAKRYKRNSNDGRGFPEDRIVEYIIKVPEQD